MPLRIDNSGCQREMLQREINNDLLYTFNPIELLRILKTAHALHGERDTEKASKYMNKTMNRLERDSSGRLFCRWGGRGDIGLDLWQEVSSRIPLRGVSGRRLVRGGWSQNVAEVRLCCPLFIPHSPQRTVKDGGAAFEGGGMGRSPRYTAHLAS